MEKRLLLLIQLVTAFSCLNFPVIGSSVFRQVIPDTILICPGSNVSIVHGLREFSPDFLSTFVYNEDLIGYDNISLVARYAEGLPQCNENLVSTSIQYYNDSSQNSSHGLLLNGWIVKDYNDDLIVNIPPNKYCVLSGLDGEDNFIIKYCQPDCSAQLCISKCCFANEVCNIGQSENYCHCADSGTNKWSSTVEGILGVPTGNYSFVHHKLYDDDECLTHHFTLHEDSKNYNTSYQNEFKILQNGSVHFRLKDTNQWIILPERKYCLDGVASSQHGPLQFSGESTDMILRICRSDEDIGPEEQTQHQFILHTILVPFAIVFVLLTILVYILTWQEQSIYGYTIFSYLVTLFCLYVFIVVGNTRTMFHANKHSFMCAFIAGAIHFSYLSSACWVTCISFDVWRTFKKMNNVTAQSRGKRRFTLFCSFSIGYPLMQVMICSILDSTYRDVQDDELPIILPNYGRMGVCNMSNDGVTYYLYVPITVMLLCNIGFFVATISSMIHYKKSIREAFADISKNANPSTANQSFGIYARLFIIMGISWISQIISWFVLLNTSTNTNHTAEGLKILFAVTDALTILQAVAIFYIFVCKRSVFANLWFLNPWLRPFLLLWVKYGCCSIPSQDARKMNVRNSYSPKGISKSLSVEKNTTVTRNDSRESNSSTGEGVARQTSLNSAAGSCDTTISDIDDGCTMNTGNETAFEKVVSETKV